MENLVHKKTKTFFRDFIITNLMVEGEYEDIQVIYNYIHYS